MDKDIYYIGIMSGTSADGADLALVNFNEHLPSTNNVNLVKHVYCPYPDELRNAVLDLYGTGHDETERSMALSIALAHFYHQAVETLLARASVRIHQIAAIGNHGQTIRHRPTSTCQNKHPFTVQIGCNQTLACLTGIRVIGDFRTKDMVLGGQGAPLVPAFHQWLFRHNTKDTFIVNLGGIANLTYLPSNDQGNVIGFDTGPANALSDAWCYLHTQQRYDDQGNWAQSGVVDHTLLQHLLSDPYFSLPYPKSTGREYFNLDWLSPFINNEMRPEDVQATLIALTAHSVSQAIMNISKKGFVYLCGGGIENKACYKSIKQILNDFQLDTINSLNLNNQAFEAMAFAWFSYAYDKKIYNHIPEVTGARRKTILGIEFHP